MCNKYRTTKDNITGTYTNWTVYFFMYYSSPYFIKFINYLVVAQSDRRLHDTEISSWWISLFIHTTQRNCLPLHLKLKGMLLSWQFFLCFETIWNSIWFQNKSNIVRTIILCLVWKEIGSYLSECTQIYYIDSHISIQNQSIRCLQIIASRLPLTVSLHGFDNIYCFNQFLTFFF